MAGTDVNDVIAEFIEQRFEGENRDEVLATADRVFFADILRAVLRRQRELDPMIDEQLAIGWRLVRVDSILRAILRGGVAEASRPGRCSRPRCYQRIRQRRTHVLRR